MAEGQSVRRSPLRFTIRGLQVAVFCAALVFALCLYVDPSRYWRELVAFLFCPLMCSLILLIVFGPWPGRVFGMGFILGFVLEHASMAYCVSHDLVRFSATSLAPLGWYPLELPLERIILLRGWASLSVASVPATFAGLLLSGVLCGGLAFAIGESLRTVNTARRIRLGHSDPQ
jgi:hypothetical protein